MSASQIITERETELYRAMLAFDYAALDDILSDEVRYIHSTAVVETKEAYFSAMRRGLYEYGAIDIRDVNTRMFNGVAMTTGVMDMLVGANGSAKHTIRLQHVLIWRLEDGKWRLLLRQATRIPA